MRPIDLDIYGIVQHEREAALQAQLRELSGGDARIRFLPALAHSDVISTLRQYDALVVPSQWMETGPLVVLEAFAAGVPVIGSALGGLTDKIRDGIDGVLVTPFDSVDAWRAAARPAGARAGVGAGTGSRHRAAALHVGRRPAT